MTSTSECFWQDRPTAPVCTKPVCIAIGTASPKSAHYIKTTIWWDERDAPKSAHRFCVEHGQSMLAELGKALT